MLKIPYYVEEGKFLKPVSEFKDLGYTIYQNGIHEEK